MVDLTGQRFGRLVVSKRNTGHGEGVHWLCQCDCGAHTIVRRGNLRSGSTLSCGCYKRDHKPIAWLKNDRGCIVCTSHSLRNGYPVQTRNRQQTTIARLVLIHRYGKQSSDIVTRHGCDNRACINPDHIIPGSNADNVHDKMERQRQARGEQHGRAKLTASEVLKIRALHGSNMSNTKIVRLFGISRTTVRNIIARETWRHL